MFQGYSWYKNYKINRNVTFQQVEDNNPAYESASLGNQASDRNPNQIDDYDYMWNHDDFEYMMGQ